VTLAVMPFALPPASGVDPSVWWSLALVAVIAVAVPLLLSKSAVAQRGAWREFRRLAAANQLTRAEARLLWRFGCAADPAQPQLAFVRPTLLDSPDRGASPELVQSIREKLFGV
jgi:hypothetical protein